MANKQDTSRPTIPFRDEDMVMQAQLRMLGETEVGNIDGRKGPKTNAAMESFAKKNGLNGADEKTIRAKISEKYAALGVTPARVDDLIGSGNINDVRAGQVAYNLQHPNAQINVRGLDNDVNRTVYAPHTPVASPVTSGGSVVMATAATPPTVTAPVPEYTQSISRAPAQVQQQVYNGGPYTQQPEAGAAYQQPTQQQIQLQEQQRAIERLQQQNNNQKQMIEEMRSPQNIEVGRRGTMSGYYNQEAGRMGGGMTPAEMQFRLREKQMDQNFELRDRQISMQETRGLMQMAQQGMNIFQRFNR